MLHLISLFILYINIIPPHSMLLMLLMYFNIISTTLTININSTLKKHSHFNIQHCLNNVLSVLYGKKLLFI